MFKIDDDEGYVPRDGYTLTILETRAFRDGVRCSPRMVLRFHDAYGTEHSIEVEPIEMPTWGD